MLVKPYSSKSLSSLQRTNLPGNWFFWCIGSTVESLPPSSALCVFSLVQALCHMESSYQMGAGFCNDQLAERRKVHCVTGLSELQGSLCKSAFKDHSVKWYIEHLPVAKNRLFTRHAWTFLDVQCFRYLFLIMRAKTEQSHLTGDNYKPWARQMPRPSASRNTSKLQEDGICGIFPLSHMKRSPRRRRHKAKGTIKLPRQNSKNDGDDR